MILCTEESNKIIILMRSNISQEVYENTTISKKVLCALRSPEYVLPAGTDAVDILFQGERTHLMMKKDMLSVTDSALTAMMQVGKTEENENVIELSDDNGLYR